MTPSEIFFPILLGISLGFGATLIVEPGYGWWDLRERLINHPKKIEE